MRTLRMSLVVAIVMIFLFDVGMVSARGGGHSGGHYRGGGHSGGYYRGGGHDGGHYRRVRHYGGYYRGGRSHVGIVIGGPYWGPSWNYPYYYPYFYPYYYPYYYPYTPAVTTPSVPQEYIERSRVESKPTPSDVWYYCPESKAYYPYVRECPAGWQTVPAQPPSDLER